MSAEQLDPSIEAGIETRRAAAMKLRIGGKNYREIAKEIGVSLGQAYADVKAVLDRTKAEADDDAEQARAIDIERIDRAITVVEGILANGLDEELLLKALDRLVKLQDQRAKLLGLYAPEKKELTGADGAPIAIDARSALLGRIASLAVAPTSSGATASGDREPE